MGTSLGTSMRRTYLLYLYHCFFYMHHVQEELYNTELSIFILDQHVPLHIWQIIIVIIIIIIIICCIQITLNIYLDQLITSYSTSTWASRTFRDSLQRGHLRNGGSSTGMANHHNTYLLTSKHYICYLQHNKGALSSSSSRTSIP